MLCNDERPAAMYGGLVDVVIVGSRRRSEELRAERTHASGDILKSGAKEVN